MQKHKPETDILIALQRAQSLYQGSLEVVAVAALASRTAEAAEPVRNVLYPLDLQVDGEKVNALLG